MYKFSIIGALLAIGAVIFLLPPSLFGMEFPLSERFSPDSKWIKRTFPNGNWDDANSAINTFYMKIVFGAIFGGIVGFLMDKKNA